ncbi:MAG: rhodanese-like domain-containing protein [Cytophagales bacterium]
MNNKQSIILIAIIISGFLFSCSSSTAQNTNLEVVEFEKAIQNSNIQLLDVRTAEEYAQGHIKGALQANWNDEEEFQNRIKALDKSAPLYVYCRSGGRSANATQWLQQNGFSKVHNLLGGITAWEEKQFPIEIDIQTNQMTLSQFLNLLPKDKKTLVDISAVWCPPCKKMEPIMDSLKKEGNVIITIDGGSQKTLVEELNIKAFPTFIFYDKTKEYKRLVGLQTFEELKQNLDK